MSQPEARIVVNRSPPDPDTPGKMTTAKREQATVNDQIRARRKEIHNQAKVDATGPSIDPPPEDQPPPPIREDIDTIEFVAPNGMRIEYGPRHDISLVDRIARLYNGRDPTVSEFRLTRILMGIRMIDGKPPITVVDEITRTKLANTIGDELIDLLMYYDRINWPPLQQNELPVIKKRFRT